MTKPFSRYDGLVFSKTEALPWVSIAWGFENKPQEVSSGWHSRWLRVYKPTSLAPLAPAPSAFTSLTLPSFSVPLHYAFLHPCLCPSCPALGHGISRSYRLWDPGRLRSAHLGSRRWRYLAQGLCPDRQVVRLPPRCTSVIMNVEGLILNYICIRDTSNAPANISNGSRIQLRNATAQATFIDIPLAIGFNLRDGAHDVTVPTDVPVGPYRIIRKWRARNMWTSLLKCPCLQSLVTLATSAPPLRSLPERYNDHELHAISRARLVETWTSYDYIRLAWTYTYQLDIFLVVIRLDVRGIHLCANLNTYDLHKRPKWRC